MILIVFLYIIALMKFFKAIMLLILFIGSPMLANEPKTICIAYEEPNLKKVEMLFKEYVKPSGIMIFTYVPRGLIISIEEKSFFNDNSEKIHCSSLIVLDNIGKIMNVSGKNWVVEGHTEGTNNFYYKHNWEISLARANNIVKYLMRCAKVSPEKIVPIGFGEFMPFADNVSDKSNMNNRIDFVILDYEAKR